ncbi:receptor-like serine/threonine-protein kinase SD1-8 [Phoenix dactylifera]|uniref:Receptor-like serine/threonine-protein kinase n=1 Tax=Phoenix dactylifera TaxID=42345 RepID=A0A8B9A7W2_PHODC|nr:receptor-like serine/threonine-protein kinase SD1-8 [Phoenix dactylifera]
MRRPPVFQSLLFLLSSLFSLSVGSDILTPTQPLRDGQILISAGGIFELGFFSPINSNNRYVGIWYRKVSVQTVVWVANRQHPISEPKGSLSITANGTLVVTDQNSTAVWSAGSSGLASPVAQLLDSGNFIVKEANGDSNDPGSFAWQSFDYPTDTLLPGMKLGWNLTSHLNRNLTAWTDPSDPAPGYYSMALDVEGDPEIFLWAGAHRLWRTGPWVGQRFSGIPEMKTYSMFTFDFVMDRDEIYYAFNILNGSVISRLIVNQSGVTQRLVWLDQSQVWSIFWFAPKDQCDGVSPCGPFGLCDTNNSPICDCLQGFEPRSPTNWALRDGSDGCKRKTALDCRNGTDGFVTVNEVKLPDTSNSTVDMSLNLDQCRAMCLRNCSCTAYASANSSGGGCITWTTELTDLRVFTFGGQDIYVRLAAADLGSASKHSHQSGIAAIVVGSVLGTLLLGWIGSCIWYKKRRRRRRRKQAMSMLGTSSFANNYINEGTEGKELDLPLYDLGTIIAATDNFSIKNKLGEGGFGPVYMGNLGEEQEIAVKRLAKTSVQGIDEFKNEVTLIAKLQHRNLVRLLGCCIQGEERMLIYEYMPNKSLDAFLFDKAKAALLDWQTRYNIILGIARGLLYLHQDSRLRIIHRDLKASNILLDKEMNPKISDFGLARIFGGDEAEVNTHRVVGTYGYMSPEYAMDGIFSVKSDVFSFGVLVLEIISSKKNRGVYLSNRHINLLGHAWNSWKEGNGLELVDESIGYSFPVAEVLRCIKVGLLCVQEHPEDRPAMSTVVLMLGSESSSLPYPKPPGFVANKGPTEIVSSSSKQDSLTINDLSVTVFEGR